MTPRQFAISVVEKLQSAGYEGLWAGGCVRDQVIGRDPQDYDVATNATPDQIRDLFGKKRTLPIGAAFGVITVLGPKSAGQIEVATFRRDSGYSDGRRPDSVEFTDAREDAIRRDFTINGMFFDPLAEKVIDYVGGQVDLKAKLIRAIGEPHERIEEDKLRMLRGVRFAATFNFQIEPITFAAIKQRAGEISVVSEERIGAELFRMFSHPNKSLAAQLLLVTGLLKEVLPQSWAAPEKWHRDIWETRQEELKRLASNQFEPAAAILLRSYFEMPDADTSLLSSQLKSNWRLTNQQRDCLNWIVTHWQTLSIANQKNWSTVQPLLIHQHANAAVNVAEAILGSTAGVEFCRQRLSWTPERLNPSALLLGADLIKMGERPGPQFKELLQTVRALQLDGEIDSVDAAMELIRSKRLHPLLKESTSGSVITVRQATVEEVIQLRHAVLRAGLPRESALFSGDKHPSTRHWVALETDQIVGVVSVMAATHCELSPSPDWQLRGMAVSSQRQRNGIGSALLQSVQVEVAAPLWCHARVSAVAFYQRHGWRTVGDSFDIESAGRHFRMVSS